jgi:hypothetical protein
MVEIEGAQNDALTINPASNGSVKAAAGANIMDLRWGVDGRD